MSAGIKLKFILKKLCRSYHRILEIAKGIEKLIMQGDALSKDVSKDILKKVQNKTTIPAQNITENSCNHNRNDTNIQKQPF